MPRTSRLYFARVVLALLRNRVCLRSAAFAQVIGQRWSVNMPGAAQIAPSNPATLALWGQRLLGMEMAWDNAEAAGVR